MTVNIQCWLFDVVITITTRAIANTAITATVCIAFISITSVAIIAARQWYYQQQLPEEYQEEKED